MTEFTHTYKSVSDCASKFVPNNDVDFTLEDFDADERGNDIWGLIDAIYEHGEEE